MHCGLLASHASTLSTGAFDAPGSASKFSRLLPTCPKRTHAQTPEACTGRLGGRGRATCASSSWASAPYGFTEGAGRPARLAAGLRPACAHAASVSRPGPGG